MAHGTHRTKLVICRDKIPPVVYDCASRNFSNLVPEDDSGASYITAMQPGYIFVASSKGDLFVLDAEDNFKVR